MATLSLKFSKNLQSFFTYPLVPHFIFSCQQILFSLFFRIYPESGYLDPHFLHCHHSHSHYHLSPQSIAFTCKWLPYFCPWEFLTVCSEKSIKRVSLFFFTSCFSGENFHAWETRTLLCATEWGPTLHKDRNPCWGPCTSYLFI